MRVISKKNDWFDDMNLNMGDFGEELVENYLFGEGYNIYYPTQDVKHSWDGFAVNVLHETFAFDVKTKPRRQNYEDTGINIKHFNVYKKSELPFKLFFVDGYEKKIYGNYLTILKEKDGIYPLKQKGIIYFPLNKMITYKKLDDDEAEFIMENSNRKYLYSFDDII